MSNIISNLIGDLEVFIPIHHLIQISTKYEKGRKGIMFPLIDFQQLQRGTEEELRIIMEKNLWYGFFNAVEEYEVEGQQMNSGDFQVICKNGNIEIFNFGLTEPFFRIRIGEIFQYTKIEYLNTGGNLPQFFMRYHKFNGDMIDILYAAGSRMRYSKIEIDVKSKNKLQLNLYKNNPVTKAPVQSMTFQISKF